MAYKTSYPGYLVHFNKNHNPKNGQFDYGDGDGDGIADDHAHRSKKKNGSTLNVVKNIKTIKRAKEVNSDDYKKHHDRVIKKGTTLQTLSVDKDRTKDTDMFYASYIKSDNDSYSVILRNIFKKALKEQPPETIYDENGKAIGTGQYVKRILNTADKDLKVASEDSGIKHFKKLYRNDNDFKNYVNDPNRMGACVDKTRLNKNVGFKEYKEAAKVLNKLSHGYERNYDLSTGDKIRIGLGAAGLVIGGVRLYNGIKYGTKKDIILGSIKLIASSRNIAKGTHFIDAVKDKVADYSNKDYEATDNDLATVYKLYNWTIPSDGKGNAELGEDVARQRAKFFNSLKKDGYSACLDTNDALYNNVKATSPVIVFDTDNIIPQDVQNLGAADFINGYYANAGRKLITGL